MLQNFLENDVHSMNSFFPIQALTMKRKQIGSVRMAILTLLARITYIYARARPSATAYYIYVCSPRLTSSRVLAALAGKCLCVFL